MADSTQNQVTDQLNTMTSKTDQLWNLFTYGTKAYIDKETSKDSNNMPDKVDLTYQNRSTGSMSGGQPQATPGGMSGKTIALLVGGGVIGLIILKKTKVI